MCVNCIRSQVDITEGIQKQVTLLWCKECERYLQPPKHWVRAALESKELLTLCIKRLKGLQKVCPVSLPAKVIMSAALAAVAPSARYHCVTAQRRVGRKHERYW